MPLWRQMIGSGIRLRHNCANRQWKLFFQLFLDSAALLWQLSWSLLLPRQLLRLDCQITSPESNSKLRSSRKQPQMSMNFIRRFGFANKTSYWTEKSFSFRRWRKPNSRTFGICIIYSSSSTSSSLFMELGDFSKVKSTPTFMIQKRAPTRVSLLVYTNCIIW